LLKARIAGPVSREWLIYLLGILGVGPIWLLVQRNDMVGWGLLVCTLLSLGYIAWFIVTQCNKVERERMMLALVLTLGSVVFFTLFEQAGTSLNLFADRNVDMRVTTAATSVLGLPVGTEEQLEAASIQPSNWWSWIDTEISAAQSQSFNAGFILIFAPIFAALWAALGRRNLDPNPTLKFGFALIQVGLGFLLVVWGAGLADTNFRLPLMMLVLLYLLHTTGELCLSPVGLSEITKLSVPAVVSFMMAVWFLASSIAQYAGGIIAGWAGTETAGGQVLDSQAALATSVGVFNLIGWTAIGVGVAFMVASPLLKHWAHGVNDPINPPDGKVASGRH
jgi:POT family proton-dependent oligopeptide transporter